MKNRLNADHERISFRLLLSYLAILAAPLIAIVTIYQAANHSLLEVQRERTYRELNSVSTSIDRRMDELHNVGILIAKNTDVASYLRSSGKPSQSTPYFQLYELVKKLPDYTLTNNMISAVYLVFQGSKYMIQFPVIEPVTKLGFSIVNQFGSDTYQELEDFLFTRFRYGEVISMRDVFGADTMVLLESVMVTEKGVPGGMILIQVKPEAVQSELSHALTDQSGGVFILDAEGNILQSCFGSEMDQSQEISFTKLDLKKECQQMTLGGQTYEVCAKQSGYERWIYVSITSKAALSGRIGPIKSIIILLSVCSVGIGLILCLNMWNQRRTLIKKFCDCYDQIDPSQIQKNDTLWSGFYRFLDRVSLLQETVSEQTNLVQEAVLRKICFQYYDSAEDLEKDLKSANVELNAQQYYAGMIFYEDVLTQSQSRSNPEFRAMIQDYAVGHLGLPSYYIQISDTQGAFLILDYQEHSEQDIAELLKTMQYRLMTDQKIASYIGMSRPEVNKMNLYSAMEDARKACEYARYYQIRVPVSVSEIPKKTEHFWFPVEMEIQLINSLKKGQRRALDQVLEVVQDNFTGQKLSVTMGNQLMSLIKSCASRTLMDSCSREFSEKACAMIEGDRQPEELAAHLQTICDSIAKEQEQKTSAEPAMSKLAAELVTQVSTRYMEPDLNLSILAEVYQAPESRLYREFKQGVGQTFSEYLESVRMQNACRLLKEGIPVNKAAAMTGYSSDYSFRRAFKRVMGMAPSEFK